MALAWAPFLAACAGTTSSDEPFYPRDWPPRAARADDGSGPDLCGTFRAVSDPAGPLEYPCGGYPHEMFLFVPYARAKPPAQLGRRNLSWHLASVLGPEDEGLWQDLARFAAALEPGPSAPDGEPDLGWVQVTRADGPTYAVRCGVGSAVSCSFLLEPSPAWHGWRSLWSYPPGYTLRDGGLVLRGAFVLSPLERAAESDGLAAGTFTFYRAVDGSLVMVESLHYAPRGGEVSFQKWWRWRVAAEPQRASGLFGS